MNVIIDCDTGIDDAYALMYLVSRPEVHLIAAGSVWGNVAAGLAATNTLRVLELCEAGDIPVAVGAARPLVKKFIPYDGVHGSDGLGNTQQPAPAGRPTGESAAEQLVRVARSPSSQPLTIVATGPLTNIALACLIEPDLPQLVDRVVVMGGAVTAPGNVTELAEANMWGDPDAARILFGSGVAVTMVGLDVTMRVLLDEQALHHRGKSSAAAQFAQAIGVHYFSFYEPRTGRRAAPMHDLLAAQLAVDPDLADYDNVAVDVLTADDKSRGITVVDRRPWSGGTGPVAVPRGVDAHRAIQIWLNALDVLP